MKRDSPMISAEGFLAEGTETFHTTVSRSMEKALGHDLPQVEIRFHDLSITAELVLASKEGKHELPTLWNHAMKSFLGLCRAKHTRTKTIVHPVTGVLKPSTMTLVLGQPGSGKSSFMQALAGIFPVSKSSKVDGVITYNSRTKAELVDRLPQFVSYTGQRDHHYHTLNVQETLEFAHQCSGGAVVPRHVLDALVNGADDDNAVAVRIIQALYAVYPDVVVQQLGLTNCKDTVLGSAMLRGVSGGERKRVTIGEMGFGMKPVSLLDEISTGLDSAATYDIIKAQQSASRHLKKTIVVALLQPAPEVFDLFDDLILFNQGFVMYHGPRAAALAYFEAMGFKCPPTRDVADFLLDLGTPQQDQYVFRTGVPRLPSEYADLFQKSYTYHAMFEYVVGPTSPQLLAFATNDMHVTPMFYNSFTSSVVLLIKRQLTVLLRNRAFIISRVIMTLMMGLLYGSSFYQMDPQLPQVVIGVTFQSLLFFIVSQVPNLPAILDSRHIFYKQRDANFYSTLSFVVAHSVSQIPFAVVETLVFGNIMYWIAGFVNDAAAYLTYMAMLFLVSFAFSAWFFFLGSVSPDLHVAKPAAMMSVVVFILFGGFIIVEKDIPTYFMWLFWINPIAWVMRALAINQYTAPEFQVHQYKGVNYKRAFNFIMGDAQLRLFDFPTDTKWIGYGMAFMALCYFLFTTLSFVVLEFKRHHGHGHSNAPVTLTPDASTTLNDDDDAGMYVEMPATPQDVAIASKTTLAPTIPTIDVVPVTVAFQNLGYVVPNPKKGEPDLHLLTSVTGYALPGTITALMGSTGAGKTTLMDVIAGRKTEGTITGSILLNGYPATDLAMQRCTGYCEQMDIHSESATFREALTFSAMLRQPSEVSTATKLAFVEECLAMLDLTTLGNTIIRGSSVEQMKRLTIGVELAAAPSVLFLDEPTSGLDARSAKIVMSGIRRIASTGRTVVCTIHQPSTEVFEMFDRLLLLQRGGQTVFFGDLGPQSIHLIEYFSRVDAALPPLVEGANPATWMLECIGAGVEVKSPASAEIDFVRVFQQSPEFQALNSAVAKVASPSSAYGELTFKKKRAAPWGIQCRLLVQRFMRMYWRTASYNWTRLVIAVFLAVLFGAVFCKINYNTFAGANGGAGVIFITALFLSLLSFNSVLPLATEERESFYRERASQTYSAVWYFVGATVAELPYVFFNSFLFTAIFYPFVGFQGTFLDALFYGLNLSLMVLMNVYMGQLTAYAAPRVEVATLLGILINSIFFLFMGFNPPSSSIPAGYRWLYHVTPQKYSLAAMTASVFAKCDAGQGMGCGVIHDFPPFILAQIGKPQATMKDFIELVYEMKYDDAATNTLAVLGFIVVFRLLALLALIKINHQKK
ncbi:hypothetical protein H310_03471 [Aphanomyces invadans]|uniref:ABC transporter domain-containing protein n=1 Tax=Aphanomyces invadans TaxID=157072 RepID=A0A024UIV2_9STRA|nr:hypothetical protein H310_03471 [Aphanomyces invadans]ETW05787.1 hypothetical protein H310_03471 [Aphanomyces invadans]|eukprot:XP_008865564.1 hypothetical protein H310_03471 [Aphanomyces invadans]